MEVFVKIAMSIVRGYVASGIIPRPRKIGSLVRWRWVEMESAALGLNASTKDEKAEAFGA